MMTKGPRKIFFIGLVPGLLIAAWSIMYFPGKERSFISVPSKKLSQEYESGWELGEIRVPDHKLSSDARIVLVDTDVSNSIYQKKLTSRKFFIPEAHEITSETHADRLLYMLYELLPNANVSLFVVADSRGRINEQALQEALQESINQNYDIINMSFVLPRYNREVDDLLRRAYDAGIISVSSTGNDGANQVSFPSSSPYVIGVGASDVNGELWRYSNYGTSLKFCMPGVNVTVNSNNERSNGTSYSALLLTGVIAALIDQKDSHNQDNIIQILKENSHIKVNSFCGFGIPNFPKG